MPGRPHRAVAVVLALVAMLSPCALDAAIALHVAWDDHHGTGSHHDEAAPTPPASAHGHPHAEGTPDHDHGASVPDGVRPVRHGAVGHAVGPAGPDRVRPGAATPVAAVAITPSPPIVTTTVLRI